MWLFYVTSAVVQKWLFWFYDVLLWFDSLIIVHCELKHVGIFSMISMIL